MHFIRLRLSGFKSFVDPTEIHIEPGLSAIVGPNGCGKSNVVEALGWVMGETSPKRMRGGEMDDVIFAGSADRPPRNLAEVALHLDNAERRAPAQFNDWDELEVIRRIERGSGSAYRVNGREARARDVQLLFADALTGAHSTALVGQGRVDALINAKATERRVLLEEASGITGLHTRRHEADLRLGAAETNLSRLDDVMAALEAQLQGLKRQVRQAKRYRNISGHIRRAEAILLHLGWSAARVEADGAARRLSEAEAQVVELTRKAATASKTQARAAQRLPGLRDKEAEAAARLHRLVVARDGLEAEEQRVDDERRQLEARLVQIGEDEGRERDLQADAAEAAARLEAEGVELEAAGQDEAAAGAEAEARLARARQALAEREARLWELSERAAAQAGRRHSLSQQMEELAARATRLNEHSRAIAAEREGLAAAQGGGEAAGRDEAAMEAAQEAADAARVEWERTENERGTAQAAEGEAREELTAAETEAAKLRAEAEALARLLAVEEDEEWAPLIDQARVEPGYERVLGAALGDDLSAPADEAAPVHWKVLEPYDASPPLPAGAEPLSRYVQAPAALARRLGQVGVVADKDGPRLAPKLAQGQRLVGRSGALWRWDGYTVSAGASTVGAQRLEHRNRLDEVREVLVKARACAEQARQDFDTARTGAQAVAEREREARAGLSGVDEALQAARQAHLEAARRTAAEQSRGAALAEAAERIATDLADVESRRQEAREAWDRLPPEDQARDEIAALQEAVGELSQAVAEAESARHRLAVEAEARKAGREAIAFQGRSWRRREEAAASQLERLAGRRAEAEAGLIQLGDRPAEFASRRKALGDQIDQAEDKRKQAADAVAAAETELAARDRAAKAANEALAAGREDRVRLEAAAHQAREREADLVRRIAEALDCEPEQALAAAGAKDADELPPAELVESRLDRLKRERDNMGPVNLRAETEAAELTEQLETMRAEGADLRAAIARLRQGISSLNREARERLLGAFGKVDGHFRELFTRLFGGGRARLELTESDDPLEAGLELVASPAGKRLQVMSLLSGGEQAMTALALIFAVFLTNPAPICILDEVDAPLDDNNVSRFVDLVEDIARSTGTRFLLVTHNPITMARMDRLYGVTMSEHGVSRLVSVDLARAEGLRAAS